VLVRPARVDDAPAIARIQTRGWQVAYRHVFPPVRLDAGGFVDEGRWRERIVHPPRGWATIVADSSGAVAGFACVGPSRDQLDVGELYAIYVDPGRWRSGAGRALIAEAERALAGRWGEATLWVLEENPRAQAFYAAAGWTPDGARKAEERFGVAAPEVRYRKRLSRPRSRS
jgi:GNAT superfamily N-acetyltransferase